MLGFLRALRSCSSSSEGIFDTFRMGSCGESDLGGKSTLKYSTGRHEHQDARTLPCNLLKGKKL